MGDLEAGLLSPKLEPKSHQNKEVRPRKSPKAKNLNAVLSTILVAFGPIAFGFSLGFTSPTQQKITEDLGLSIKQFSLYGSLVNVGAMLGAATSGSVADRFGRKWALAVASVPYILGWFMNAMAQEVIHLYIARLLVGFGVGIISFTVPIYIAEIAPPNLRGRLGTFNQLSVTIGIFLSYLGGLKMEWRTLAFAGMVPCWILLLGLYFIPETPRWLAKAEDRVRLRASLETLRGRDYDVATELSQIQAAARLAAADESSISKTEILKRRYRLPLLIGIGLLLLQQFGGINAIMFYSSSIFSSAGFRSSNLASFFLSSIQVIMTAVAAWLMDKAGRRLLLLISAGGMGVCCFLVALSFYLKDMAPAWVINSLSLGGLVIYIMGFSLGMGPIPWIVMSEIFPSRVSGIAGSIATSVNWMSCFVITVTFNSLLEWSSTGSFILFGAECLFTFFFVWILLPETGGRTFEEIQALLKATKVKLFQEESGDYQEAGVQ